MDSPTGHICVIYMILLIIKASYHSYCGITNLSVLHIPRGSNVKAGVQAPCTMAPTASETLVAESSPGAEYSDMNFDCMFKILLIGNSGVGKTSFLLQVSIVGR